MSMISEQIKKLRDNADVYKVGGFPEAASTMQEAADTIESLSTKLQAEDCGRWIPCKERLPTLTGKYIVCKNDSIFSFVADFVQGQGANYWCGEFVENIKDIDYWMPLPEPYHET